MWQTLTSLPMLLALMMRDSDPQPRRTEPPVHHLATDRPQESVAAVPLDADITAQGKVTKVVDDEVSISEVAASPEHKADGIGDDEATSSLTGAAEPRTPERQASRGPNLDGTGSISMIQTTPLRSEDHSEGTSFVDEESTADSRATPSLRRPSTNVRAPRFSVMRDTTDEQGLGTEPILPTTEKPDDRDGEKKDEQRLGNGREAAPSMKTSITSKGYPEATASGALPVKKSECDCDLDDPTLADRSETDVDTVRFDNDLVLQVAQAVRITLVVLYLGSSLWKLNEDFLDTSTSCSSIAVARMVESWKLSWIQPSHPFFATARRLLEATQTFLMVHAPWVVIAVETTIACSLGLGGGPTLAKSPTTTRKLLSKFGVVLGILYHLSLAWMPDQSCSAQYSVVCVALYFFWFPYEVAEGVNLLQRMVAEAARALMTLLGFSVHLMLVSLFGTCVAMLMAAYDAETYATCGELAEGLYSDMKWHWGNVLESDVVVQLIERASSWEWSVSQTLLFAQSILLMLSVLAGKPNSQVMQASDKRAAQQLELAGVIEFFCVTVAISYIFLFPLLGCWDIGMDIVQSNLRLHGGSNHLFLPTGLLQQRFERYADSDLFLAGGWVEVYAADTSPLAIANDAEVTDELARGARKLLARHGHVGYNFLTAKARVAIPPPWEPMYTWDHMMSHAGDMSGWVARQLSGLMGALDGDDVLPNLAKPVRVYLEQACVSLQGAMGNTLVPMLASKTLVSAPASRLPNVGNRGFIPYTIPAFELRRLITHARAQNKAFSLQYKRRLLSAPNDRTGSGPESDPDAFDMVWYEEDGQGNRKCQVPVRLLGWQIGVKPCPDLELAMQPSLTTLQQKLAPLFSAYPLLTDGLACYG